MNVKCLFKSKNHTRIFLIIINFLNSIYFIKSLNFYYWMNILKQRNFTTISLTLSFQRIIKYIKVVK